MQEVLIPNFLSKYEHSWLLMIFFVGQSCFRFHSEHWKAFYDSFASPRYYIFPLL